MPDWIAAVLKFFKPAIPLYGAAALTGLLFLTLPSGAIKWLGATELVKDFRWAFGLAFMFFAVLVLSYGVKWLATTRRGRDTFEILTVPVTAGFLRGKFNKLTNKEKFLILYIVESHESKFWYPSGAETIQSLIDKGWVESTGTSEGRARLFQICWNKWLSLERIRPHVRSAWESFSDEDKNEIQDVKNALDDPFQSPRYG